MPVRRLSFCSLSKLGMRLDCVCVFFFNSLICWLGSLFGSSFDVYYFCLTAGSILLIERINEFGREPEKESFIFCSALCAHFFILDLILGG